MRVQLSFATDTNGRRPMLWGIVRTAAVVRALADGSPIRDSEIYTLATSDFLADGGDGFAMLPPLPRDALGITLLDAMVEYLRELPTPVAPPVPPQVREVEPAAR